MTLRGPKSTSFSFLTSEVICASRCLSQTRKHVGRSTWRTGSRILPCNALRAMRGSGRAFLRLSTSCATCATNMTGHQCTEPHHRQTQSRHRIPLSRRPVGNPRCQSRAAASRCPWSFCAILLVTRWCSSRPRHQPSRRDRQRLEHQCLPLDHHCGRWSVRIQKRCLCWRACRASSGCWCTSRRPVPHCWHHSRWGAVCRRSSSPQCCQTKSTVA
mmetsp:Transcript_111831/g.311213  ORF Transcript_111831/g.311213 Transcript_111831/m.311213 type:complete len:215 (+) Transcript_111831:786-1430(+)